MNTCCIPSIWMGAVRNKQKKQAPQELAAAAPELGRRGLGLRDRENHLP